MAYSDSLKVFWFNPMRAASRSTWKIQEFLKFYESGSHNLPNESHKDYIFISNFRNPYSRLVSVFYFLFEKEKKTIKQFQQFAEKKIWEEKYLENAPKLQLNLSEIFEQKNVVPQYLVKVENLYEDILNLWFVKDNVCDQLLEIMNNYINKNNFYHEQYSRPSWQEHYDEKTANMVYDFFKKDFELGNYDKDSWKNGTP